LLEDLIIKWLYIKIIGFKIKRLMSQLVYLVFRLVRQILYENEEF